jgi:hypothetical protein
MSMPRKRNVEMRKFDLDHEPSAIDDYADLSAEECLQRFLELRSRLIRSKYGADPGFERILVVARQQ